MSMFRVTIEDFEENQVSLPERHSDAQAAADVRNQLLRTGHFELVYVEKLYDTDDWRVYNFIGLG